MTDTHSEKRLPRPTEATTAYWKGCRQQQLLIQRCKACERLQFYPRSLCTSCMSGKLEMVPASGRGTVRTFTVIRHPVSAAYASEVPYALALIELEEGPTMMSALCNTDIDDVQIGMAVEVVFEQWTDEITIPKFQAATSP